MRSIRFFSRGRIERRRAAAWVAAPCGTGDAAAPIAAAGGATRLTSAGREPKGRQRGYALIWAIGLSLLFFMLIQLVLIDSARELSEARRFRARILAQTLAENGAELAAAQLLERESADVSAEDWQGRIRGEMTRNPATNQFRITGQGEVKGTVAANARVDVQGEINGTLVRINFTVHTP